MDRPRDATTRPLLTRGVTVTVMTTLVATLIAPPAVADQRPESGWQPAVAAPATTVNVTFVWPPREVPATARHDERPGETLTMAPARPSLRASAAAAAAALAQAPELGRLADSKGSRFFTAFYRFGGVMLAAGTALLLTVDCGEDFDPDSGCNSTRGLAVGLVAGGGLGFALGWPQRLRGSNGPRRTGSAPAGSSTTDVQNRTDYPIRVTFEGASSQSYDIAPKQRTLVRLAPGQYQQTVEAIGVSIVAYRALQTYDTGVAYVEQYFLR